MIIDRYNFEEGRSYIIVNKGANEEKTWKFVCKVGETEDDFETYANYKAGLIKNVFRDPKTNHCIEIASNKMDDYIFMDAETKETIPQSSGRYPWGNSENDNTVNINKEMISKLMEIVKKNSKSTPNNLTPFKRVNICQNNHSYAFINKKDNNEYIIVQKYLSDKTLNINLSEYDIYDLGIHDYVRNALYKIDTNFICYEKMHPYLCLLGIYQGIVKTNCVSGYALRFLCKIPDAFNENKKNCFLDVDIDLLNKAMNGTIAQYFYAELIAKPLDEINPSEIMREDLVPTGLTKAVYYHYEVLDFKDCKKLRLCFLTDNYEGTCANSAFIIEYKKKPV